ncbi:MAG: phospholipase D family protein [Myxococcales bacterium]|nr:phospholipase D family protein [Myxococcales bacterium]
MLSPEARTVAMDLLRAPPGYRLDLAILTTYTLDLETVLALPLAVLAQADKGIEELLADPLLLLEALREAGGRVHIFVDAAGIGVPRKERALYAMLEESIHPLRAPNGGAFHPKVWVARFVSEEGKSLVRAAVLSRNLTFDRSWDIAFSSEAAPKGKRNVAASRDLGALLRALPSLASTAGHELPPNVAEAVDRLADESQRTSFPAPDGFDTPITFQGFGLGGGPTMAWRPNIDGTRLLAVAPFVNRTALDALRHVVGEGRALVSRQEELDSLPEDALAGWSPVYVLSDTAHDEPEDDAAPRPSGLHAKFLAVEQGWYVTWYVGSANLTKAAFEGHNVEMMVALTGKKGRAGGHRGHGIDRFLASGFSKLLVPYRRNKVEEEPAVVEARELVEAAKKSLTAAELRIACAPDGEAWTWKLDGRVVVTAGVGIRVWPITIPEEQARPLALPRSWTLPTSRLTCFVGFHISAGVKGVDDARMVLKVPAEGLPEGRLAEVLRSLIDSPERFLRFLRALLGGLEGLTDWADDGRSGSGGDGWGEWLGAETLLEDLVRVASRDPQRLEPVRRLIADLRTTDEGRRIVPDDLLEIWQAVDGALAERGSA